MEDILKDLSIDRSTWKQIRFGDIVAEPKESVKDPVGAGIEHIVGLEHIESENIHLRRSAGIDESTTFTKKFSKGDVLFGRRRAYLKKAAQASFGGICSGDITVMRVKKGLLPELLPFVVQNEKFFDFAVKHSAGGLSPRVKFKDLANYEFLLPPKEQQAQLAELLWSMDEIIECSYKNHATTILTQKTLWLSVKDSNCTKKIKDVARVTSGTTPSTKVLEYWQDGNIPWLSTGKVHDKFISNSDTFVTQAAVDQGKSKIFPKNSTLVAMIGQGKTRGNAAKLMIDSAINQNFACIEPKQINHSFLFYCLFFSYQRLRSISQGTNQLALNCALIKNFKIPYPTDEEQHSISESLKACDQVINKLESQIKSSKSLQKSLINQVF